MTYKIGIVGGVGFVGATLARHLSGKFQIKLIDIREPQDFDFAEFTCCDIRDYSQVVKALEDVDFVIHTAIIQIPLINEQKKLAYDVNLTGTQNVCKAVDENPRIKGMIMSGSWHTVGERELKGVIDEEFGFRPDKVEERARLYALSKIAQESIVRFYDEMSDKIYGVIRMGTVLGKGMPEKTAANIFIKRGLKGEKITPYKHSMYRPMLYVNISDICRAFEIYATRILNDEIPNGNNSLAHIVNVYYNEPTTIIELAETVKKAIVDTTNGKVQPEIEIVDTNLPPLFTQEDRTQIKVDLKKARELLGLENLKSPNESILELVELLAQEN